MSSTTKIFSRKLKLEKNIKELSDTQMFEVYRLIKDHGYSFTKNNNGIFFSLLKMNTELFTKIEKYVNYSIQKNIILKNEERKIEELKTSL